jgi:hypothetical protein
MLRVTTSITLIIAFVASTAPAPGSQPAKPTTTRHLLDVIPASCLGAITVANVTQLDGDLVALTTALGKPSVGLVDLFEQRLKLGPRIPAEGPLGIVFMPPETAAALGQNAVLILPCDNVEAWLKDFTTVQVSKDTWRSDLVWGPTFVGHRGGFALLGTSAEAVKSVLNADRTLSKRLDAAMSARMNMRQINAWIDVQAVLKNPVGAAWIPTDDPSGDTTLGTSILNDSSTLLSQCDMVHVGLEPSPTGIQLSATLSARNGLPLASVLAFDDATHTALSRLPDLPVLVAASGTLSTRQREALSSAVAQILTSPRLDEVTKTAPIEDARRRLLAMVSGLRSGAVAWITLAPSPDGLTAMVALWKVESTASWMEDFKQLATTLGDASMTAPGMNPFYSRIEYKADADTMHQIPVHELDIHLHAREADAAPVEGLDYSALISDNRLTVRAAALPGNTVALAIGGHPREMGALIASATGLTAGMTVPAASGSTHLRAVAAPPRWIALQRTLARLQRKVDNAPPRLEDSSGMISAEMSYKHPWLSMEAQIPLDVIQAILPMVGQQPGQPVKSPAQSN